MGQAAQTSLRYRIEHCLNYGGALKIIGAIEDPPVIVKILSHLVPPGTTSAFSSMSPLPVLRYGSGRRKRWFKNPIHSSPRATP